MCSTFDIVCCSYMMSIQQQKYAPIPMHAIYINHKHTHTKSIDGQLSERVSKGCISIRLRTHSLFMETDLQS